MDKILELLLWVSLLVNVGLGVFYFTKMMKAKASRRWQQSLTGSSLTLEEIFSQLPGNVYWKNRGGILIEGNKMHSHAYSRVDDLKGVSDYDLFPKEQADKIRVVDREIMRTGESRMIEEEATDVNGVVLQYLSYKAPLRNAKGEIIGIIGNSLDITDAKKNEMDRLNQEIAKLKETEQALQSSKEAAEKATQAKSDFIAVVSHELRTPLAGMLGMLDILRAEVLKEDQKKEYLNSVNTAARYLLSLINNILDFSKIDADKFRLANTEFNFLNIIHEAVKILEVQASSKNISLNIHYPENIPKYLIGDSKALSQILLNIISNAIKFTHEGGVTVSVEVKNISTDRVSLSIEITDTGVGVPKEKLEKIFEAFEQVDPSHTRHHGGTGLGLAVTRRLVDLMGGDILVDSVVNQGTKFMLTLSFELGKGRSEDIDENLDKPPMFDKLTACKVLLVEDDALIQFVHKHKLESLGCKVHIVSSGLDALSAYKAEPFDLILMDIGLPDLSGNEIIRWIRKAEIATNVRTPIIALTAYSDQENHDKSLETGADIVLCKPVENNRLREAIQTYVIQNKP